MLIWKAVATGVRKGILVLVLIGDVRSILHHWVYCLQE